MKNSGFTEVAFGEGICQEEDWGIFDERPDLISTELV